MLLFDHLGTKAYANEGSINGDSRRGCELFSFLAWKVPHLRFHNGAGQKPIDWMPIQRSPQPTISLDRLVKRA